MTFACAMRDISRVQVQTDIHVIVFTADDMPYWVEAI